MKQMNNQTNKKINKETNEADFIGPCATKVEGPIMGFALR